jgi:hypothetical protein
MAVKSALDALNAALESGGTPADDENDVTPPETEEVEADETDGDAPDGEETETDETPDGEEDEGDETPDGEEDEGGEKPDGEEGDGEGEESGETAEEKAAREAAEKAAELGTGDILEDPIPKDLNKRTQGRIVSLIDTVKELQPDAQIGRELMGHIEASQMTAEEFSMALTFGKLKHSDNVEDNRKAYQILWQGIKELAPLIGETIPGVDPLDGHADLQKRVAEKTLDPKDASEIAAGRNRVKATQNAQQRAQQSQQTAQQREQERVQAEERTRKELNEVGKDLAASDPHFEAKMEFLKKQKPGKDGLTPMQRIAKAPAQFRVNAFLRTFMAIKLPAAAPVGQKQKPKPQPMRAGKVPAAGAGGVRREPKSAIEAMDVALGLK